MGWPEKENIMITAQTLKHYRAIANLLEEQLDTEVNTEVIKTLNDELDNIYQKDDRFHGIDLYEILQDYDYEFDIRGECFCEIGLDGKPIYNPPTRESLNPSK